MKLIELFDETLVEGVHDPYIFKAIFMLGGPASGKTTIAKKLFHGSGLKRVDVDEFFEMFAARSDLPQDERMSVDQESDLYYQSSQLAGKRMEVFLRGRLGLVFDGTGRNFYQVKGTKEYVETLGYQTMAILVNTDLRAALKFNKQRQRKVRPNWFKDAYEQVQANIGKYNQLFGSNFVVVDNSERKETDLGFMEKMVNRFLEHPVRNPVANDWFSQQTSR